MVVCIALGVDDILRGSLSALIYRGDRVTWKVLAEDSWSPTTTQSDSFLYTAASSTPIRVVTKEVRYIHELSLTLEHSMSKQSGYPRSDTIIHLGHSLIIVHDEVLKFSVLQQIHLSLPNFIGPLISFSQCALNLLCNLNIEDFVEFLDTESL